MNAAHWLLSLSSVATGLLLVLSSAGWGRLVARWSGMSVDWGLALAWGMSVLLFLGGLAVSLGQATAPVLIALELGGVVALATSRWQTKCRLDRAQIAFFMVAAVVLGMRIVSTTYLPANEPCDDLLAYQPLVQQVLQAGDMEAPFSLRRLAAFGGQTLLQAMAVPSGDPGAMLLLDAGLAPIFLLGLAWSWLSRHGPPRPLPLAVAVWVGLGLILRVNSASQATSVVCFFALVRTALLIVEADRRVRLCMIYGLLAAAASSLRHFNLPFPLLLLLALLPGHVRRVGWGAAMRDGGVAGLSWLAFLAPWMVALYASSGTPLYPLFKGYHDPAFNFFSPVGKTQQVAELVVGVLLNNFVQVPLLVLPAAFWVERDRVVRLVQGVALVAAAIIMASFSNAAPLHMSRYIQPALVTACLATILSALASGAAISKGARLAISAIVVFGLVKSTWQDLQRTLVLPPQNYPEALHRERLAAYAEAQQLAPVGVPIFVYLSAPFGFDQARNRILNADEPGPVSPPPGLPFFKGAEAVASYLKALGIHHVAFEDFDTAVVWCLSPAGLDTIEEPLWQPWKPYLADLRANLRELARTKRVLYDAHGVTLVDLDAPH